jgi:hypothetical protein
MDNVQEADDNLSLINCHVKKNVSQPAILGVKKRL